MCVEYGMGASDEEEDAAPHDNGRFDGPNEKDEEADVQFDEHHKVVEGSGISKKPNEGGAKGLLWGSSMTASQANPLLSIYPQEYIYKEPRGDYRGGQYSTRGTTFESSHVPFLYQGGARSE